MRKATPSFLLLPAACIIIFHTHAARAETYTVVPDPTSAEHGDDEVFSLPEALEMAEADDTINLADGVYAEKLLSQRSGREGQPITITGGRGAVINAPSTAIEINHSWITLEVRGGRVLR